MGEQEEERALWEALLKDDPNDAEAKAALQELGAAQPPRRSAGDEIRGMERQIPDAPMAAQQRASRMPRRVAGEWVPFGMTDDEFTTAERKAANIAVPVAAGVLGGGLVGAGMRAIPLIGNAARTAGAGGMAARAATGAAEAIAGDQTARATEAAGEGKPVLPAMKEGLENLTSPNPLKNPALAGNVGEAAGLVASGVKKASPWIARRAAARESGVLASVKGLKGEAGTQQAADEAQKAITVRNSEKLTEAGAKYGGEKTEALRRMPEQAAHKAIGRLDELRQANRTKRTGEIRDADLEAAIDETERLMDIDKDNVTVMLEDIVAARDNINLKAQRGQPETKENRPFRKIYRSLNDIIASRKLRAADEVFHGQKNESERLNDILYRDETGNVARGVEDGVPDVRASKETSAAGRISRYGDDNKRGTPDERHLDEVAAMDPAYKQQLDRVLAQKSQVATSFGMNKNPGRLSRLLSIPGMPFVEQNMRFVGGRLVEPMASGAAKLVRQPMMPALAGTMVGMSPFDVDYEQALARLRAQKERKSP